MIYHYENLDIENTRGTLDESLFRAGIVTNSAGELDIDWDHTWSDADRVTVAFSEDGEVVGLMSYNEVVPLGDDDDDKQIYCSMIWTHPDHRRKGIAKDLWRVTLAAEEPRIVGVDCVSPVSVQLHQDLEKEFPGVVWLIDTVVLGDWDVV